MLSERGPVCHNHTWRVDRRVDRICPPNHAS